MCGAFNSGTRSISHFQKDSSEGASEIDRRSFISSSHLEKLLLIGKLRTVPQWFNTLQNLKYLNLQWSELREDALPHIQALPNLLGCPQLNEILVERGAMPNLEELPSLEMQRVEEIAIWLGASNPFERGALV
ncbi:hypothetical protein F3Y22_tig00000340pilonHSYRG00692 [Hibiscus syriacus]|uniref:Uncharacterized protein n=1 Tax=Hibiscus syriacus TaxID=106335 RepID=A0A6A3D4W7_HIBSY|nr:hypothetical protein F3Y22_tig00000340pilonHSYRG00692 [Hibiscus syriacus]